MRTTHKLRYDVRRFPLAELVRELLGVTDLATLPSVPPTGDTDQATPYHQAFYAGRGRFEPLYQRFVRALLADGLDRVYVQRMPTLRVHLPGAVAVRRWHRDREFGHDESETNYWVPLTRAYGTNTVWIEGVAVEADYGEVVVFDGANLIHGNMVNDTGVSRASLDFRTIPRASYRPTDKRTVSAGIPFLLGEYWGAM